MIKEIQLQLLPSQAHSDIDIRTTINQALFVKKAQKMEYEIIKQSIDARGRNPKVILKVKVYIDEFDIPQRVIGFAAQDVSLNEEVHIIGAGPAGLFCALDCIERGLKPVIFERGKNIRERRRDLAILNKEGILNEESNYCFGEGGAGTYSDGKLYTRSNKRGNIHRVLELFHLFGAKEEILYEAHPHIGTNKLPQIIETIREKIIECGGEIHFNSKLTDLSVNFGMIDTITINASEKMDVKQLVLATGHSARDIYELLYKKNILIESKPFALGVRIEHPQHIIDSLQYHCDVRDPYLPPASYSAVEQVNDRGVFSFCMCPGGIIAPASTQKDTLVVNGWSPSKRDNPYANSGIVVSVDHRDFKKEYPLSGLDYQLGVEQKAFLLGGGKYVAPAQRMIDFVKNSRSISLPDCSYLPGVNSVKLSEVLPKVVNDSLVFAFKAFGEKMSHKYDEGKAGYFTNDAIIVATESRTSSPVRITRDAESLQHVEISNLYPCAEGAGYAGGIVSAAMDGMRISEKISEKVVL
jgi:uncharacterized FAD-dependent dehydrogenase